jgi:hypothetical protein
MDLCHICKIIGHCHSGFRCRVSGVSSKKVRAGLKPDTRHLKPILRKGFTTPDNVQKKRAVFIVNYEVCRPEIMRKIAGLHTKVKICRLRIDGHRGMMDKTYGSLFSNNLRRSAMCLAG